MYRFFWLIFVASLESSGFVPENVLNDYDDFFLLSKELFNQHEALFEQHLSELSDLKRLLSRVKHVSRTVFLACLLAAVRSLAKRNVASPAAIHRFVSDETYNDQQLVDTVASVQAMHYDCARIYFNGGMISHGADVAAVFEALLRKNSAQPTEQLNENFGALNFDT